MAMIQRARRSLGVGVGLVVAIAACAVPAALAEPSPDPPGRRLIVEVPARRAAPAPISRILYLERCRGGCVVHHGDDDARTLTSNIPSAPSAAIGEFASTAHQVGAAADAEWAQVVQCVTEVYSPYDVVVTDAKPAAGSHYHEALVAGLPTDIGLTRDILGIAPLASDCRAIDDELSFTFANQHSPIHHVLEVCWTASQESAHAFGLDHEYEFANHRSACSDPMTYRNDCGGEKFFRNQAASCGETAVRSCKCGATQNSHLKLLSVFGPGAPITGAPTVALTAPAAGDAMLAGPIEATAGAKRGVARVEAWFNGFAWAQAPGAAFLLDGQLDPSAYELAIPAELPDSIVDVQAVAYDDLGAMTQSAAVTLTKGAPCIADERCARGQRCDAGRCRWDPPIGELGEACDYPQFCKTQRCEGVAGETVCSQPCIVDFPDGLPASVAGACPDGLACGATGATADSSFDGVCVPAPTGAGCCRVGPRGGDGWSAVGLGLVVAGLARRRRKPLRSRSATDDDRG
jgi:hypothetical protein